jgi:hypothetical protein
MYRQKIEERAAEFLELIAGVIYIEPFGTITGRYGLAVYELLMAKTRMEAFGVSAGTFGLFLEHGKCDHAITWMLNNTRHDVVPLMEAIEVRGLRMPRVYVYREACAYNRDNVLRLTWSRFRGWVDNIDWVMKHIDCNMNDAAADLIEYNSYHAFIQHGPMLRSMRPDIHVKLPAHIRYVMRQIAAYNKTLM